MAVAQMDIEAKLISMSIRHMTKSEMSAATGLPVSKITAYLDAITRRASQLNTETFQAFQRAELAKLDEVEREAWIGWEQSKSKKTEEHEVIVYKDETEVNVENYLYEREPDPNAGAGFVKERRVTTKETPGDPRFLELVIKSSTARAKLLGADKVNINVFQSIKVGAGEPDHQRRAKEFLAELGLEGLAPLGLGNADRDGAAEPLDTDYTVRETSTIPDGEGV